MRDINALLTPKTLLHNGLSIRIAFMNLFRFEFLL